MRAKTGAVFARGPGDTFTADLMGPWDSPEYNFGYEYILVVEDVYSRYAWAFPLKTKTANDVWTAFARTFAKGGPPHALWTDAGSEFAGVFASRAAAAGIEMYTTQSEHKAALVERLNRTLGQWINERREAKKTASWVDQLPEVLEWYNEGAEHRGVGVTPARAYDEDPPIVRKQYDRSLRKRAVPPKFKIGDWVRIDVRKKHFEKGRTDNWSREVFRIGAIVEFPPPVSYRIEDAAGENLIGPFYTENLQKTALSPEVNAALASTPSAVAAAKESDAERALPKVATITGHTSSARVRGNRLPFVLDVLYDDGSEERVPLKNFVGRFSERLGRFVPGVGKNAYVQKPVDAYAATHPEIAEALRKNGIHLKP